MKKWVAIVFSVYLLMASSPFFAVAKQDVSARETAKEVTEQVAKQFTREGVKTGAKAAEKAAQTAQRAAGGQGVSKTAAKAGAQGGQQAAKESTKQVAKKTAAQGEKQAVRASTSATKEGTKVAKESKLWSLTKEKAPAIKLHREYGKIYKSKSDGLWWAIDKAKHGGSKFKVFKETPKGFEWIKDADEYGNFILNKHKGAKGLVIPKGELKTVK